MRWTLPHNQREFEQILCEPDQDEAEETNVGTYRAFLLNKQFSL